MRSIIVAALALAALTPGSPAGASTAAASECRPAIVHYTPYPGGAPGLGQLPWVRATSPGLGLVALLWYWPDEWQARKIDRALILPGGQAPGGWSTKIMWVFLSDKVKRLAQQTYISGNLIVRGERLDGPGRTWQQFVAIGYDGQNGAPSFASTITLPSEGCWRLRLGVGGRLRASVVFEATTDPNP
jgi:hypothetical protein